MCRRKNMCFECLKLLLLEYPCIHLRVEWVYIGFPIVPTMYFYSFSQKITKRKVKYILFVEKKYTYIFVTITDHHNIRLSVIWYASFMCLRIFEKTNNIANVQVVSFHWWYVSCLSKIMYFIFVLGSSLFGMT